MIEVAGILFLLVILGYGTASVLFALGLTLDKPKVAKAACPVLSSSMIAHTVIVGIHVAETHRLPLGPSVGHVAGAWDHPLATIAWLLVAVVCIAGWIRPSVKTIGGFLAPVALAMTLGAILLEERGTAAEFLPESLSSVWFPIHILAIYGSLSLFALAFASGLAYLLQHARLKNKSLPIGDEGGFRLPSLEVLDRINHHCFTWGLAALTVGIVMGTFQAIGGAAEGLDLRPKIIFTIGLWVLYCTGWSARSLLGWGGRKAALIAVLGFVGVLVSIVLVAHA
jgi:ABC-type transport system involved in cytochrome c biogenesis permease subunit